MFYNVQRVQLEPVHADVEHGIEAGVVVRFILSGKTDDQMGAHRNPALPCRSSRGDIFRQPMTAIDAPQGFIESRLQAELQHYFQPACAEFFQ